MSAAPRSPTVRPKLGVFCRKLLRVGTFGFGGPLVTLNLMKEAFVTELGWLTEREYLERMGICKLLPGPVSSLMALYLGRMFFGPLGSLLGLVSYLLPAFTLILIWVLSEQAVLAYFDSSFATALLWSFRLYIVASLLVASQKLLADTWNAFEVRGPVRFFLFVVIMGVSLAGALAGILEIKLLALALLIGIAFYRAYPRAFASRDRLNDFTSLAILLLFFIASVMVFGTGYMLFPYLERELVLSGALSAERFQTGILLGNLSPGPVVIASTYYGWMLGGFVGAVAATVGVFGGPALIINALFSTLERMRARAVVRHVSLCIVPAVVTILLLFNYNFFRQVAFSWASLVVLALFVGMNARRFPLGVQFAIVFLVAVLAHFAPLALF